MCPNTDDTAPHIVTAATNGFETVIAHFSKIKKASPKPDDASPERAAIFL